MQKSSRLLLAICLLYTNITLADPADLSGHPSIPQHLLDGITLNGYIAASYSYLSQSQYFTSGTQDSRFITEPDSFALDQANLTIAKIPEQGLGWLTNFMLGSNSYVNAPYGMQPWFDSQNAGLSIEQAYFQYAYHSFSFIGGKFYSLAGYEPSDISQLSNASGSILAGYAEPTSHLGVRSTYAVNDKLNLIVGVNDGWDNVRDWSRRKTIELGTVYTDSKYNLSATWYNGQERAANLTSSGPKGIRNLLDLFAAVNVTDKLTLAANYDYVTQNNALLPNGNFNRATWQGIAGYVLYQINPKWRTALRAEYFNDRDGYSTGVPQSIKEMTVTLGYLILKDFEIRAEARRDIATTASFQGKNGSSSSNNMQAFTLEGIMTF